MAAAAASPVSAPPTVVVTLDYWQQARLKSLELAKASYKSFFRLRAQEFIRGKGALAVVTDNVCMGCTHCFDNCAFESIDMVERKFSLPEYSYTSRKAVIIEENCVGCEKCAIACPVDAITMIPQEGYEVKDGRLTQVAGAQVPDMPPFLQPPKPGAPRPPVEASRFEPRTDADRVTHRISAAFKPKAAPVPVAKPAEVSPPTAATGTPPAPAPPPAVKPAEPSPPKSAATSPPPKAETPPPPPPPPAVKPAEPSPPKPTAPLPPTEEELPQPPEEKKSPKKKAKEEK